MAFGLRALILLAGLCACGAASFAGQAAKLTDYVSSEWLKDDYPEHKIFIAKIVDDWAGAGAVDHIHAIQSLNKELDSVRDETWFEAGGQSVDGMDEYLDETYPEALASLEISGEKDYEWFAQLIEYTGEIVQLEAFPRSCRYDTWVSYLKTINAVYGDDLDGFISGRPKQYGKFREFLHPYGKKMLKKCMKSKYTSSETEEILQKLQPLFN